MMHRLGVGWAGARSGQTYSLNCAPIFTRRYGGTFSLEEDLTGEGKAR